MTLAISSFRGRYGFLSNFYVSPMMWCGLEYATVEHAFQSRKSLDPTEQDRIRLSATAREAKRLGRRLELRTDWLDVRIALMRSLVQCKFGHGHSRIGSDCRLLRGWLLGTGDAELIEGNTWGDRFWGTCDGAGQNQLGRILMELRAKLRSE